MTENYLYLDGIENIVFIDGVLRMDTVTLSKGTEKQPSLKISGHLCMSPAGLLRTYQQMGQVLNGLVQQGVLEKKEVKQQPLSNSEEVKVEKSLKTNKNILKK